MSERTAASCALPPLAVCFAALAWLAIQAAHAAEHLPAGVVDAPVATGVAGEKIASAGQIESAVASPPTRWASSAELVGRSYRWSLSRGALDLGMRFDAPRSATQAANLGAPLSPVGTELPALSLGWRLPASGRAPSAGTLLERAMESARGESAGSKIGVEWKPAEPQINFLREGLGIRLEGNDRMTVRLRKGMLGIYMHRKF